VAIDLFQGDISTFSCDRTVVGKDFESVRETSMSALQEILGSHSRHLTIAPKLTKGIDTAKEAAAAMESIKDFLKDQNENGALRRITFLLNSGEEYRFFQDALFSTFEE